MNEIIKLAIEKGGYIRLRYMDGRGYEESRVLLDPQFWQCLGKALQQHRRWRRSIQVHEGLPSQEAWLFHWHRYIDELAQGGDTDKFFNDLINAKRQM